MAVAIQETNFELPGQIGEVYRGKVGDTYTIGHEMGELLAVVRSDRISAFDVVLNELVPYKGQVLSQMSGALLEATADVAPNWLIETPDPNVTIGHKAAPFMVEMIMRGYLLGSSWKGYSEQGMRDLCGNTLPDGMTEFQPFAQPLLTPTTKAELGRHDENITPTEIIESGLATQEEYDEIAGLSFALFERGQAMASERGLILADTKYEFGRLATGQIVVIDEVHTPDSSRYFPAEEFAAFIGGDTETRPEQLSKEFVREWLKAQGFTGAEGEPVPALPEEFIRAVSERYIGLYETMLGKSFERPSDDRDPLERIETNIIASLERLAA